MSDDWFENHGTLGEDQKRVLYNELKKFDEYGEAVYQEQDLNVIAKKFEALTEYAKRYLNENASDKFDSVTINRNMKEIEKKVRKFKKEAEKVQKHRTRLTALYDDIGMKLNRYFEVGGADEPKSKDNSETIEESNKSRLSETKLRKIIREEAKKLTELDARMFRRIRKNLRVLDIGGGVKDWTNQTGDRNRIRVDFMNGETVFLRQVLTDKVKILTNQGSKVVRDSGKNVAREIQKMVE